MKLTQKQRQMLRNTAAEGIDAIERMEEQLRLLNPQAFHTSETLDARMFHHEPPHHVRRSGFVHSIASGRTALAVALSKARGRGR